MAREVAEWNHDETERVIDWPLRELLLCYLHHLKTDALRSYETALLVWASRSAMGAKIAQPEIPTILRER